MLQFRYALCSHSGCVREKNEDNFFIDGYWRKDLSVHESFFTGVSKSCLITAVFDGMGGEEAGEVASQIAAEIADKYYQEKGMILTTDNVANYISESNQSICNYMDDHSIEMGTTMVALEIVDGFATMVNIGDSRCYHYRDGQLERVSTDHSVVERMISTGQIVEVEARNHPRRHEITQYLGIKTNEMILEPTIKRGIEVQDGDCFILCSDGLTEALDDDNIKLTLQKGSPVKAIAKELLDGALSKNATDNITIIVIKANVIPINLLQRFVNRIRG